MKQTIVHYVSVILFISFASCGTLFSQDQDSVAQSKIVASIEKQIAQAETALKNGKVDSIFIYYNRAFKTATDNNLPKWQGEAYHGIGRIFFQMNKIDTALAVFIKAKKFRTTANDLIGLNKTLTNMCQIYQHKGQNLEGLALAKEAIEVGKKAKYHRGTGIACLNGGHFSYHISRYEEALEYYLEASNYFDTAGYDAGVGMCFNSIANIYMNLEKFDFALEYYKKNLYLQEKLGNTAEIANTCLNLGSFFQGYTRSKIQKPQANPDSMFYYYNKALDLFKQMQDPIKIIQAYTNIGTGYNSIKNYSKAKQYFDIAYKDAIKYNTIVDIANIENGYGLMYQGQGNYKEAKKYFLKAFPRIKAANLREKELMWYKDMADNSDSLAEYKQAVIYLNKFIDLADTIREQESQKTINQLTMRYGSELKDQEIEAAKERQMLMQEKNDEMQKRMYFIIVGLIFIGGLLILVFYSFMQKRKANALLVSRNEEIMQQKEEIEVQRNQVMSQKNIIEEQQTNILDSIHYACRIQEAILPQDETIEDLFHDNLFVLFKPRDIVSGDFYWLGKKGKKKIVVAADCTGHGVPGAFMSMLGTAFLNEIIGTSDESLTAGDILNKLRENIIVSLRQTGKSGEQKDGMDLALFMYNEEDNSIDFAGANNPLIIIRELSAAPALEENDRIKLQEFENETTHIAYQLIQIQGDKMPIGIYSEQKSFESVCFQLLPNDSLYIFSDGYQDQFGGAKNKKFMVKRLKQLLVNNKLKPMAEQKSILDQELLAWIEEGKTEQVDDVLVIGFQCNTLA